MSYSSASRDPAFDRWLIWRRCFCPKPPSHLIPNGHQLTLVSNPWSPIGIGYWIVSLFGLLAVLIVFGFLRLDSDWKKMAQTGTAFIVFMFTVLSLALITVEAGPMPYGFTFADRWAFPLMGTVFHLAGGTILALQWSSMSLWSRLGLWLLLMLQLLPHLLLISIHLSVKLTAGRKRSAVVAGQSPVSVTVEPVPPPDQQ